MKVLAAALRFGYTELMMASKAETTEKVAIQYVVDEKGRRTAVLLPIEVFEELVELAEQRDDIRHLEAAKNVPGEPIPLEEFEAQLRAEGKLR